MLGALPPSCRVFGTAVGARSARKEGGAGGGDAGGRVEVCAGAGGVVVDGWA